jgi:hypothetical protein
MTDILWTLLNGLFLAFFDKALPAPTVPESELCEKLREEFRQYPPVDTTGLPPSEAAWMGYMNSLRELVLNFDPRGFLRWAAVVRMMSPTYVPFFVKELQYLKQHRDWNTRWRHAITESPIGYPLPFILWPSSSGNLIRHAYYVAKFEEATGRNVGEMDFIFEFGGGYGCMCRLVHHLGFRGTYVIYDLPLFTHLQEFYLASNGLGVNSIGSSAHGTTGITCLSNFERLESTVSDVARHNSTMFIATESFSEIPIDQREKFLPLVLNFGSFLVTYSHMYREANNIEYFVKWKERFGETVKWFDWQNRHVPGYTYLIGKKIA